MHCAGRVEEVLGGVCVCVCVLGGGGLSMESVLANHYNLLKLSILRYLKCQEFIWKVLTTSNCAPNLMFLWQPYLKVIFLKMRSCFLFYSVKMLFFMIVCLHCLDLLVLG